jgi:hypothetical protein
VRQSIYRNYFSQSQSTLLLGLKRVDSCHKSVLLCHWQNRIWLFSFGCYHLRECSMAQNSNMSTTAEVIDSNHPLQIAPHVSDTVCLLLTVIGQWHSMTEPLKQGILTIVLAARVPHVPEHVKVIARLKEHLPKVNAPQVE